MFQNPGFHEISNQKGYNAFYLTFFIMDVTLICTMFEELPRQGPGSDESTAHAYSFIPPVPKGGHILDIGCGSGMQTLTLARLCPDSKITATDIYQPFLDDLMLRAKKAGLDGNIVAHCASMDNLPFTEASYDLIWSEGSAFIIGLLPALHYWKQFLKPEGHLVVSDCTWFTNSPSDECREFLDEICPDMKSESDTEDMIRTAGYSVQGSFRLADAGWWDNYYTPLSARLPILREKYANNADAQMIIQGLEKEMEIHQKYSKEYGYTFFVLKKQ
ncbi:MAG TPA: methyltransferase domain-containing protein [Methanospirillum sp.]|nr:methyltransferase domain-containing protein [Methanospirillum sp.]